MGHDPWQSFPRRLQPTLRPTSLTLRRSERGATYLTTSSHSMKKISILLGALLVALGGVAPQAQIKRLDLEQMTTRADHGIIGRVISRRVEDHGSERHGFGLYYTVLTIQGESLYNGRKMTVEVVKRGGWIDKERGIGSWDSEAATDGETALGKRIVAYYKWVDDLGAGRGANIFYASHGSMFRTVEGPTGTVVMGRGNGYAINKNTSLTSLRKATAAILEKNEAKQSGRTSDQ